MRVRKIKVTKIFVAFYEVIKHYLIKLRSKISIQEPKNMLDKASPLGSRLKIFLISTDIELIYGKI
jgi:hypothetical protein